MDWLGVSTTYVLGPVVFQQSRNRDSTVPGYRLWPWIVNSILVHRLPGSTLGASTVILLTLWHSIHAMFSFQAQPFDQRTTTNLGV